MPTVTDANLVLGRLRAEAFLGGRMVLQREAAVQAVGRLAEAMGLSLEGAAEGIIRVANEHMARALRVISVQRGIDPRGYTLVSFGGAGGLHVCALADALGLREALVPVHAGVLSALGMLAARPGRQLVHARPGLMQAMEDSALQQALSSLAESGVEALQAEGLDGDSVTREYSLDLRYQGQSYTLNLPWRGIGPTVADFHCLHEARYGHRLRGAVELVNLRVSLSGPESAMALPEVDNPQPAAAIDWLRLSGIDEPVARYERLDLAVGQQVTGPALITEMASTTWLAPGWHANLDRAGNLLLHRQ